ncbi:hypothetical protein BOTBODRAFT_48552 [Botryobasidium botryosum FD-172 SS1]|uniref:Uncharacterized protein n=1 Tax=Botryobasidium botryosum (strain FD-172 SS1) TaxID=930990 RepID=A0A067LWQ3_BOTB1|nr:hypothetical protein BOTBODRAFT_48552 [Botryobasidium botryosum FD-172 SS1]
MPFGPIIDNNYIRTLPEYQGKPDSALSAADRGRVAMAKKKDYENEAIERLKKLKENYGNGVSTLVHVYNASGDRITLQGEHSWRGSFYGGPPESFIENGQWGVFLHVKPTGAAVGSAGAVIYRTAGSADIFVGWQNPWNTMYQPTCHGEASSRGWWWDKTTKDHMLSVLDDEATSTFLRSGSGYTVSGKIGDSTTSQYEVVVEKL